jgi:hypothetical protein
MHNERTRRPEVGEIRYQDNMQRCLAVLVAAEEILRVVDESWSGLTKVARLQVGPLSHISDVTEFLE